MRSIIFLLLGLLAVLVACNDTPVAPTEDYVLENCIVDLNAYQPFNVSTRSPAKSNGADVTKTIIFHESTGTFGVTVNPEACADFAPPLQMVITGGGTATHIGRYTVENLACVDPTGAFLSPVLGFITAANGDIIYTQMGAPYPDLDNPPNFYYPYTIIGGSEGGRFEDATGYITMYGIVDYVNGTWNLTGEGEITY